MRVHTKDKLANALRATGLAEMADRAATGYYHDYLSPLDLPEMALVNDLAEAAVNATNRAAILSLRQRVIDGVFDASKEESDEWAASPEGQQAFRMLRGSL